MKNIEIAKKHQDYMVEMRRYFHENPELSGQELKTIEKLSEELGRENVGQWDPWMASESYNQYLQQWPGVFAFLGIRNEEKGVGAAHHNQEFDIDEDVLYKGAAASATYAIEYLKDKTLKGGRKISFAEYLKKTNQLDELARHYREDGSIICDD